MTVVIVALGADWISAVIIAVTIPLIPLFMSLVGASTKARMARQMRLLQRLAGHFLDVVAGLPTLKVFGRAKAQAAAIRDITDQYRTATMATLKVAFLSSLILELLATISVALVAVAVGLRLLGGHLSLATALFVLILAPEAYLPLRLLGTNYHASAEGMKAADDIFEVLERPVPPRGDPLRRSRPVRGPRSGSKGWRSAIPDGLTRRFRRSASTWTPGRWWPWPGPAAAGSPPSSACSSAWCPPSSGSVRCQETSAWPTWTPMPGGPRSPGSHNDLTSSPARSPRTSASGRPDASDDAVRAAIAAAGLDDVVARLPMGLDTVLGHEGAGLSAGERQRVALARAFVRDAPLLLLDEPTANLDGRTEESVLAAVRRLMAGRTVVIAAHRPSLLALADRVVHLAPAVKAAC